VRIKQRHPYLAASVFACVALAAFVVFGGGGAGATPGKGKAVGVTAHAASANGKGKAAGVVAQAAPASGSVGGGNPSGDTTSPQPPSKADFSGHGANVHGPYDSTRDGSPSGNGNGNGNAVGKPCAGCVGKADNKNPHGQMPNGSDPNAGYECDRNHGIGRTNPAHTGCTAATTPPPPCETDCGGSNGGGGCVTDCGGSNGGGGCVTDCGGSNGGGGCVTDCGGSNGGGSSSDTPPAPEAASAQAPANDTSALASTGAINAGLFAGIAAALLVLGVAALALSSRLTRRRTD
jgi:hypothetical protein